MNTLFLGLTFYLIAISQSWFILATSDIDAELNEDRLSQALLIVDILKKEYIKLLRERNPSSPKTKIQPTCASTLNDSSTTITSSTKPLRRHRARTAGPLHTPWTPGSERHHGPYRRFEDTMSSTTYPPLLKQFPRFIYRRNFPDYFYEYGEHYGPSRRMAANYGKLKNLRNEYLRVPGSNEANPDNKKNVTTSHNGIVTTTLITTTNSHATTLKPKTKSTTRKKKTRTTTEKWPAFSFKPTLRVFLGHSTPLPIPLPENNAFCFWNPTNFMCRSP